MRYQILSRLVVAAVLISTAMARSPRDYAIELSAECDVAKSRVVLSWPLHSQTTGYQVLRKLPSSTFWDYTVPSTAITPTGCVDTTVAPGTEYEYSVRAEVTETTSYQRIGYVRTGAQVPVRDSRGKIILIVDNTKAAPLAAELQRLVFDLIGDGWGVIRRDVDPNGGVEAVRSVIKAEYAADRANVKAVLLFGHVPVPYSGDIFPDGHLDHKGAWPADVIYGDMDGVYTSLGDGRYANSVLPEVKWVGEPELQVGRVDFWNMPAFGKSEVELLREYLDKNHAYRSRMFTVPTKAIVDDELGILGGWEAPGENGWRNFAPVVGMANAVAGDWSEAVSGSFLFGYGCGYSSYSSVGGVVSTADFAAKKYNVVFNLLFGSYFGDWNTPDNALRAALASGTGLASVWGGRPNWFLHPMAMGETIGFCTRITQGNGGTYWGGPSRNGVHIALMGDPTLRLYPVAPASSLQISASNNQTQLSWAPSVDNVLGYHVYVSDNAFGPYSRITTSPVSGTSYTYDSSGQGKTFMVRAIKLQTSPSGTFYNSSQGAFSIADGGASGEIPTVTVAALESTGAESGPKAATIRVSRTGNLSAPLSVDLKVSGSAANGTDFFPIPEKVSIPAGAAFVILNVVPVKDDIAEGTETASVTVQSSTSYQFTTDNSASISIQDAPLDEWRAANFTPAELGNIAISGLEADPDGDGVNNLRAYAFNLDPHNSNGFGRPVTSLASIGSERHLQVTYRRNKRANDVTFRVEVSEDLGKTWASGADVTEIVSQADLDEKSEIVVVRDRTPLGGSTARFMRVRVSL